MGKHRAAPAHPVKKRAASFLIAGAIPLSLVLFDTPAALADSTPTEQQVEPSSLRTIVDTPDTQITLGYMQIPRPEFLTPEQTQQINSVTIGAEDGLTQALQSAGVDAGHSRQIAKSVLTDAAIGASVGSVVASPIAWTGAVVGVISGAIAGLPFAPIGLLVVPIVGAVIGYAMVAAPFMAIGAGVGALVGVVQGAVTPLPPDATPAGPDQPPAS